ncbi:MAG: tetratricopeptide repeat protein [Nodosilinea sp.]
MHLNSKVYGCAIALSLALSATIAPAASRAEIAQAQPNNPSPTAPLEVNGVLDATSNTLDNGEYYNIHTFEGTEGQDVVVDLVSEEFDTYLIVFGPEGNRVAENDDGDGSNARVRLTLPVTGTYRVRATSYGAGEVGSYQLSWQEDTALVELQQALEVARESGDLKTERQALNEIAAVHNDRDEHLQAADYYLQGVEIALKILEMAEGEEATEITNSNVAFGYQQAGYMYQLHSYFLEAQGDFEQTIEIRNRAIELAERSLPYAIASNLYDEQAHVYLAISGAKDGLSNLYFRLSQHEEAVGASEQALEALAQISFDSASPDIQQQVRRSAWNALSGLSNGYYSLGERYREEEDYEQALESQEQALTAGEAAINIIQTQMDLGLPSGQDNTWEEMRQVSVENLATIYSAIASIYEDQYEYEKALEFNQRRLEIARKQSNSDFAMSAFTSLSRTYGNLSQYQNALSVEQQMLELAEKIGNEYMISLSYFYLGSTYDTIGQFLEAIDMYEQGLRIARQEGFSIDELNILNNLATVYQSQGRYDQAFENYDDALVKTRDFQEKLNSSLTLEEVNADCGGLHLIQNTSSFLENSDNNASTSLLVQNLSEKMRQNCMKIAIRIEEVTLNNIASLYSSQGKYEEAIELYNASLEVGRQLNDPASDADTLSNLAKVYADQGNYREALKSFQEALVISKATNDQPGIAFRLSNIGSTYKNLGDYKRAVDYFQQALTIAEEINLLPLKPTILSQIGGVRYAQGDYDQAISIFHDSLTLSRQMGLLRNEAIQLDNLGSVASTQGRYEESVNYREQALAIYEQMGTLPDKSASLVNLGQTLELQGKYAEAIAAQQEALDISRSIDDRDNEAYALRAFAATYLVIGQYERAKELNQQALAIYQDIGDRSSTATVLNALGEIHTIQEEFEQAFQKFGQALALRRENGELAGQSATLRTMGFAYEKQENYSAAKESFEQALSIQREIGARGSEGITLNGLGSAQLGLGNPDEAAKSLQQALALHQELGDRPGQAKALSDLGKVYLQAKQLTQAETTLYEALDVLASLRASELTDTDKIALFDTQLDAYDTLQQVLVAQNNPAKALTALEISERGRARAFVESLTIRLADTSDVPSDTGFPDLEKTRQIARQQNATLVEYSIVKADTDESELYIWVISPTGNITFRQQTLQGLDLASLVQTTRSSLGIRSRTANNAAFNVAYTGPTTDQQLQQLHELLIEPIADLLPTDPEQRVITIPQGDLFLVPFSALLNAQGQYLIEQHTLLTAPSIQVLDLTQQRQQQLGRARNSAVQTDDVLIVGNPEMPTVRIPSLNWEGQLDPLPGALAEAQKIAAFFNTQPITGAAATEERIKQQIATPRFLHLATHGLLEYGLPGESEGRDLPGAIALTPGNGEDGLLTAAEIYDMNLNAELVVLSACDTGRGKITGDGVVGLSRAFISAGAPSVVVSLWSVPYAPTADLMVAFYQQLQQGQDKAQALRQAMLTVMAQPGNEEPKDWAAFTLIGEAD